MIQAFLVCCAMLADGGKPAEPTAADRVAYDAARDKAGKNAAAHVRLALWCEARGLSAERIKHLTLAATLDPKDLVARRPLGPRRLSGQMGQARPGQRDIQNDPRFQDFLHEYLDRRVRTPQKAEAQLHHATWCLEQGLQEEAMARFHQPLLALHLNGPSPTLRIAIDGDTVVATGIHRFWKAGKSWTMARDLKAGDRLRDRRHRLDTIDRARRKPDGL